MSYGVTLSFWATKADIKQKQSSIAKIKAKQETKTKQNQQMNKQSKQEQKFIN